MSKTSSKKSFPGRVMTMRFVLLDFDKQWRDRFGRSQTISCSTANEMQQAIEYATRDSLWISSASEATEDLLSTVSVFVAEHHGKRRDFGDLLMLESPRARMLPSLHGCFRRVIGEASSFKTLPMDQLADVLSSDDRMSLFIGGAIDDKSKTIALVRGNLETITVALSFFRPSGTTRPDFRRFALDDYGHTIQFGNYEASADAILYELDPDYRRNLNAQRRAEDKGFGPSLRRLRVQRGLSREDFPGLVAKTIARIERGETGRPQGKTLVIIEKVLNMPANEIESY